MAKNRIESDSMGEMNVPADRYRGAQTQRVLIISKSVQNGCLLL